MSEENEDRDVLLEAGNWTAQEAADMHKQLNEAARRLCRLLNARNVMITAWWEVLGGAALRTADGGSAPWHPDEVYGRIQDIIDDRLGRPRRGPRPSAPIKPVVQ